MSQTHTAEQNVSKTTPDAVASGAAHSEGPSATGMPQKNPRADLRRILQLSVPVTTVLAERLMSVESVVAITVGTIIEFDVPFDSDLALRVSDRPIGAGQAVKVGENFGLRITQIGTVQDRIDALGSA